MHRQSYAILEEPIKCNEKNFIFKIMLYQSKKEVLLFEYCSMDFSDYATLNQLLVLENKESYNAILIEQEKNQLERLIALRDLTMRQIQTMDSLNTTRLPQMGREPAYDYCK